MDASESPTFLINQLAHALTLDMDRCLKRVGVTVAQWFVLKQLWQQEGRSQAELQELLNLEKATVNGLIQRMLRADLLVCTPDPTDKRVQRIFLTARGRALEKMTPAFVEEIQTRTLRGFSEDERVFFVRLLARALANTLVKEE